MDAAAVLGILWLAPWWISIQRSNGRGSEMAMWMTLATIAGVGAGFIVSLITKPWLPVFAAVAVYYFVFYKLDSYFASFVDDWILNKK